MPYLPTVEFLQYFIIMTWLDMSYVVSNLVSELWILDFILFYFSLLFLFLLQLILYFLGTKVRI